MLMKRKPPQIVSLDRIDGDRIIVGLSDRTGWVLTLAALLKMFPERQRGMG